MCKRCFYTVGSHVFVDFGKVAIFNKQINKDRKAYNHLEHYQPEKNKINKASNKGLTKTQHLRENNKEKSIYNNFYDSEIERANGDEKYLRFVKFLFCENEENKKLSGILSIRDQLGYKEFCKLKEKASAEKIASCLLKMENDSKYTKGKFSLYRTLNNWVENRFLNNSK